MTKNEIIEDLKFCKSLMDRLVSGTNICDDAYLTGHTVMQNDIIRLRRELNEVRKKLDWDYIWRENHEKI